MKKKKKYITPTSELIKIVTECPLNGMSRLQMKGNNWIIDKNQQTEMNDDGSLTRPGAAPKTWGDYAVEPGGDIDIGAKTNPWGSWDE